MLHTFEADLGMLGCTLFHDRSCPLPHDMRNSFECGNPSLASRCNDLQTHSLSRRLTNHRWLRDLVGGNKLYVPICTSHQRRSKVPP